MSSRPLLFPLVPDAELERSAARTAKDADSKASCPCPARALGHGTLYVRIGNTVTGMKMSRMSQWENGGNRGRNQPAWRCSNRNDPVRAAESSPGREEAGLQGELGLPATSVPGGGEGTLRAAVVNLRGWLSPKSQLFVLVSGMGGGIPRRWD